MTKTKLEIIGPYTPEHEGPFCTRDGKSVRIICTDRKTSGFDDCCVVALIHSGTRELIREFNADGRFAVNDNPFDLMNAREVPVAREFWVNEYSWGLDESQCDSVHEAISLAGDDCLGQRLFREVLPGEGA